MPMVRGEIPYRTVAGLHALGEGITFEWLHGGKIAVFVVPTPTQKVVDTFMDAVTALVESWPQDEPLLILCDGSEGDAAVSIYMRTRVEKLITSPAFQQLDGRFALVLRRGILVQIVKLFIYAMRSRLKGPQPNLFFTHQAALEWLEGGIELR
ncbi:MAG: hypothetical protein K8I82_21505 [Anaerolineae bacterium]|nr:hypothetical protein [Anaerolineae bacterium]